ncbi:hypothetical protein [Maricaulis sp.]|uniref:hypothetical protein n=1 Tax=Maricaulis sp. TaxID=1486257 RepID=UPI00261CC3C8|nr:hypothetical protein [Maricaulis sp.]
MRYLVVFAAFVLGVLGNGVAQACIGPPPHMYQGHLETIREAGWIALARAGRHDENGGIELDVIEYLKGEGLDVLTYERARPVRPLRHSRDAVPSNFYAHETSQFWRPMGGRASSNTGCNIVPDFEAGQTYLVFGPLDYNLGFENIAGEADHWLSFVREALANETMEGPQQDLGEWIGQVEAMILVTARWDDGAIELSEHVLYGTEDSYLNTAYIWPEQVFRHQLNPTCGTPVQRDSLTRLIVIERLPDRHVENSQGILCPLPGQALDIDGPRYPPGGEFFTTVDANGRFATNAMREFNVVNNQVELRERSHPGYFTLDGEFLPRTISLDTFLDQLPAR